VHVPRVLATADQQTDTPWYRGWGEDGQSLNHGWFIGFAPANKPQVAFAVMIEYGGSGGFAGHVATQVLNRCIDHGYVKP
jgi:cell division protein FtsI/penicillin-binding protein 2